MSELFDTGMGWWQFPITILSSLQSLIMEMTTHSFVYTFINDILGKDQSHNITFPYR